MDDKVKFSPNQMVSTTKIVRTFAECLEKAQEQPIFITRANEVVGVLMSLDEYRKLLEK